MRNGYLLTFLLFAGINANAAVLLSLQPAGSVQTLGQSFSVDLIGDVPDPILGWGLDINFDPLILSLTGVTIGSSWLPVASFDGDDLAGLAFPSGISGTGVLFATFNFTALGLGISEVRTSLTDLDFSEGFILESGGFDSVSHAVGSVTVTGIPEPATWQLGGLALASLTLFARRSQAIIGSGIRKARD